MKKEQLIVALGLCCAILLSMYIYRKNASVSKSDESKSVKAQGEWLVAQSTIARYDMLDVMVEDSTHTSIAMQELVKQGKRLGLFIDKTKCSKCWEKEIQYLKTISKRHKGMEQPFILVSGLERRELKIMKLRDSIPFPMYSVNISDKSAFAYLASSNRPFFFTIQNNGEMSDIVFPDDAIRPSLDFFMEQTVAKKKRRSTSIDEKNGLEVLNPTIDLGEIKIRSKHAIVFNLKNNGKTKCLISDVLFSCNCISDNHYPNEIKPGETGKIQMTFLTISGGEFEREILVKTNLRKEPYKLILKGVATQ